MYLHDTWADQGKTTQDCCARTAGRKYATAALVIVNMAGKKGTKDFDWIMGVEGPGAQ